MARYTTVNDTDVFRGVIIRENRSTYHGPYDTIGAAKTQVRNGQKYEQKKWPGAVQKLVPALIANLVVPEGDSEPYFEESTLKLEWHDVAVLDGGVWTNVS